MTQPTILVTFTCDQCKAVETVALPLQLREDASTNYYSYFVIPDEIPKGWIRRPQYYERANQQTLCPECIR